MRSFRLFFVPLFFLMLFIDAYPQDFIPTISVPVTNKYSSQSVDWSPFMDPMFREKLMPYSIKAIKEKGISKEIHIIGTDTVSIFLYNATGFLIRVETKFRDRYREQSWNYWELDYDKNNNLTNILNPGISELKILRNTKGRITKIIQYHFYGTRSSFVMDYKYKSGKLIKVGELRRKGNDFVYKRDFNKYNLYSCDVRLDSYGRGIDGGYWDYQRTYLFDNYGRLTGHTGGGEGIDDSFNISYEDGLMIQLEDKNWPAGLDEHEAEIITTKIVYEYAHKRDKLTK